MHLCDIIEIMKQKLLLITLLTFVFTAFTNVAETLIPDEQHESLSEMISEYSGDFSLNAQQHKIILPRQSGFASQTQTRTISKRQTNQRNSYRYTLCISGKPVGTGFIRTYQHILYLFPTGLGENFRFFISLRRLII